MGEPLSILMLWKKEKHLAFLGDENKLLICQAPSLLLNQLFYYSFYQ
jgi:hypothetical protein